jgi:hypothetical protein
LAQPWGFTGSRAVLTAPDRSGLRILIFRFIWWECRST